MQSLWIKNLRDPEEKKRFESTLQGAKPILKRMEELLDEMEADIDRSELSIEAYSTPNWAEKQAHKNGQRQQLRTIRNLINLDQQKETE